MLSYKIIVDVFHPALPIYGMLPISQRMVYCICSAFSVQGGRMLHLFFGVFALTYRFMAPIFHFTMCRVTDIKEYCYKAKCSQNSDWLNLTNQSLVPKPSIHLCPIIQFRVTVHSSIYFPNCQFKVLGSWSLNRLS